MASPGTGLPESMHVLLDRGGVIVTANARAARALHRRYAEEQQQAGRRVWRTPHVMDLQSWLAEQWQQLLLSGTEDRLLLNSAQEQALWQRMVRPKLASLSLIAPAHMSTLVQQAYTLLATHDALNALQGSAWGDAWAETELFRQWARSFRQECQQRGWLPHSELTSVIAAALKAGTIAAPAHLGWLGFDRHTPAEARLIAALEEAGCAQQTLAWDVAVSEPSLFEAHSSAGETAACAQWARAELEANPAARIAILAPELEAIRPLLERSLFRTLAPERFSITAELPQLPFEFATGMPLAETPLVRAALLLLRWLTHPLPQQEITWLLLSSTLGALQDAEARAAAAQWDADLRNATCAPPEVALTDLLENAPANHPALASWREALTRMLRGYRRYTPKAQASVWVQRMEALLDHAQWGVLDRATSIQYQVRQSWSSLLETAATLDFQSQLYTFADLLATLERMAQETVFVPESMDAPVQVMGAYAAAGQSFDAVWFLGATDAAWPAPGRPHPLLPIGLQRDLGMPHATPAADSELSRRVTDRILANAPRIVFSYATQGRDAVMQQPSPLVAALPAHPVPQATEVVAPLPLESIADAQWVPLPAAATASGGQYVLKRQADCPFQAFTFHRLRVRELPIAGRGLSALERGKLLHRVLEWVWSLDTPTSPHLTDSVELRRARTQGTLRPLVEAHAARALRELEADRSQPWQRAYLDAELLRVVELVMEWLAYEDTRKPFQVEAVEQSIPVQVGGLALKMRADRIDVLEAGHVLIDYKTGEVNPSSWDGPRPEEPQLPLYAAFGDVQGLVGTLFAQVRPGKHAFKGHIESAQQNLIPNLTKTSPLVKEPYSADMLLAWREALTALAESFVRGEAPVDPREYPVTCRHCPLPGLCRIAESAGVSSPRDDNEEEPA